jgi:hypothetical protein
MSWAHQMRVTVSPDGVKRSLTVVRSDDDYKFMLHRWESGHLMEEYQGSVTGTCYDADVRSAMISKIADYYWKTAQSISVNIIVYLTDWIINSCVEFQLTPQ